MNTPLQIALLGQGTGTVAEALGAARPGERPPLSFLRMRPEAAGPALTQLQFQAEELGCPGLDQKDRARLGAIDGDAELSRLRGNAAGLRDAAPVAQAAGTSDAALTELGDSYEAVELIGIGARGLRRAAGDAMTGLVGLTVHIDRLSRDAVAAALTDGSLSPEERRILSADFAPRLGLLAAEQDLRDERVKKTGRALGPLAREAERAEEDAEAQRIFAAAEGGAALSPEDVVMALAWRRRRDEEDDATMDRLLAVHPDVVSRRGTERD